MRTHIQIHRFLSKLSLLWDYCFPQQMVFKTPSLITLPRDIIAKNVSSVQLHAFMAIDMDRPLLHCLAHLHSINDNTLTTASLCGEPWGEQHSRKLSRVNLLLVLIITTEASWRCSQQIIMRLLWPVLLLSDRRFTILALSLRSHLVPSGNTCSCFHSTACKLKKKSYSHML